MEAQGIAGVEGTKNKIWVGNLVPDIDSKQLKEGEIP